MSPEQKQAYAEPVTEQVPAYEEEPTLFDVLDDPNPTEIMDPTPTIITGDLALGGITQFLLNRQLRKVNKAQRKHNSDLRGEVDQILHSEDGYPHLHKHANVFRQARASAVRRNARKAWTAKERADLMEYGRSVRNAEPNLVIVDKEWHGAQKKALKSRLKTGEIDRATYKHALHNIPHKSRQFEISIRERHPEEGSVDHKKSAPHLKAEKDLRRYKARAEFYAGNGSEKLAKKERKLMQAAERLQKRHEQWEKFKRAAREKVAGPRSISELNPDADQTVLMLGGITEGVKTQSALAESIASEGFRTISFDYGFGSEPAKQNTRGYRARHHEAKVAQASEILRNATQDDDSAVLVAHSQGAQVAIKVALDNPDRVKQLILTNPAGLFDDSFTRLGSRFGLETIRKTLTPTKLAQKQQFNGMREMIGNTPGFLGDAVDISKTNLSVALKILKDAGIRIDVLLGAKDQVFPWRLVQEGLILEDDELNINSVSSYFNAKGDVPSKWKNRVAKTPEERQELARDMASSKIKQHKFASKWAGHDQPIIYPKQTAKLIHQLIEQNA